MSVQVQIKHHYGRTLIYPVCEKSKLFAKLAGKKTFDSGDVSIMKELGYEVNVVQERVTL